MAKSSCVRSANWARIRRTTTSLGLWNRSRSTRLGATTARSAATTIAWTVPTSAASATPTAASTSDSASAAPRPSEQPTENDLTRDVATQNSSSTAMTRRCAASSAGSAASQARPASALIEAGADALAGSEGRREVLDPPDDADRVVVHRAGGIGLVVGHPVEHRGDHPLEHHAGHVGADAPVKAEPEAHVPVALAGEVDLVRAREDLGVAVGHRPRQPDPFALLNSVPAITQSAEIVRASPGAGQ